MPAYFVAIRRSTRNAEALKAYKTTAPASFAGRSFRQLVGSEDRVRTLEGLETEGLGVLEFPSFAEAEAWFDSPEFQASWKHLLEASDIEAFLVEGS
jgi:uncharacterized protein (DUF1330 family)